MKLALLAFLTIVLSFSCTDRDKGAEGPGTTTNQYQQAPGSTATEPAPADTSGTMGTDNTSGSGTTTP